MQEKRPSAIQYVNIDDGNGCQLDFVVNNVRCQSQEILKLESLDFSKLVKGSNHALNNLHATFEQCCLVNTDIKCVYPDNFSASWSVLLSYIM